MNKKKQLLETPLVSVIVPIYNVEEYLSKCLDSLIQQIYKNIEIVLVDDGSQDDSISICKQYAARDLRIQLITQENAGVTSARMNGFLHAHGDWIMFVDADDYVSTHIINLMVQAQQTYQVDMVSCQYYDVIDGQEVPSLIRPNPGYYNQEKIRELLASNFLYDKHTEWAGVTGYLWTRLFKRCFVQAALEAGKGLVHSEDQIGMFKVLYSINSMYVMQAPLYYYVVRQGQATRSYNAVYWKNFELFFKRLQEIDQKGYLKKQIPNRAMMILKSLIKMEFTNDKLSVFQRYRSVKKNFSNDLCLLGKDADISAMGRKTRLQYYLVMHRAFFVYGAFIYLNRLLKQLVK
ncbi:glycosyltransferase family 2 protein [Mitsuokella sp. AF21-1AC]|uniref:glycosyltransferase family 2 protein n=1 Tax=Mitsuokella sp. AF21-1AC TaxID=2292235 RepID=UPI000E4F4CE0|nr:glycosyltransferase family 2 protein [Mitsuokella sp. AF21-1AC]RGS70683.1 glycosyltransferase family 2 protein [Mitsuokella sp. AF21-1AC]